VAELASALSFLHDKRIIHRLVMIPYAPKVDIVTLLYRDLKPDNILLDERGHAHITDLNIAVHYSERRMLTGVAGSMAYMGKPLFLYRYDLMTYLMCCNKAPEVLNKKGYSYTIDWWSLGVCAYELIFGKRPFRGKTNSDLTHSITRESLRFPDNAEEKCSRDGVYAIASVSPFLQCLI
jgi:serine/threonine kinase 32